MLHAPIGFYSASEHNKNKGGIRINSKWKIVYWLGVFFVVLGQITMLVFRDFETGILCETIGGGMLVIGFFNSLGEIPDKYKRKNS